METLFYSFYFILTWATHFMFTCMLGCYVVLLSYLYLNLSEQADSISEQLQGDKRVPLR